MNVNRATALTIRAGVVIGVVLMALGLAVSMLGGTDTVLYYGVLVLIVSPFAGVLATLVCLVTERDTFWISVAVVLLAVVVAGMLLSLLRCCGMSMCQTVKKQECRGRDLNPRTSTE